jgi:hypothetical protein
MGTLKRYRFRLAWQNYRVGQTIEPTGVVRDWLLGNGYIEPVPEPSEAQPQPAPIPEPVTAVSEPALWPTTEPFASEPIPSPARGRGRRS